MNRLEGLQEFGGNADPRVPCVLLLDTSISMLGPRITGLNDGLQEFQRAVQDDALTKRRLELAIVTFGADGVNVPQDFVTADDFVAPALRVDERGRDGTPMGGAINRAIAMLRERKDKYKTVGLPYYRPWAFMITDGGPNDAGWETAADSLKAEEQAKGVVFFGVGVEDADMNTLRRVSLNPPVMLKGLEFRSLFQWLSNSFKSVSGSNPGDKIALPPVNNWAELDV
jgi:uncharacterized protein YegL